MKTDLLLAMASSNRKYEIVEKTESEVRKAINNLESAMIAALIRECQVDKDRHQIAVDYLMYRLQWIFSSLIRITCKDCKLSVAEFVLKKGSSPGEVFALYNEFSAMVSLALNDWRQKELSKTTSDEEAETAAGEGLDQKKKNIPGYQQLIQRGLEHQNNPEIDHVDTTPSRDTEYTELDRDNILGSTLRKMKRELLEE